MIADPTKEACTLSALAEHIARFQRDGQAIDPYVLVKVNGQWCPVRAGIAVAANHPAAVEIEYLPPDWEKQPSLESALSGRLYRVLTEEGKALQEFLHGPHSAGHASHGDWLIVDKAAAAVMEVLDARHGWKYRIEGKHGATWEVLSPPFDSLEACQMALADSGKFPLDRSLRVVRFNVVL